MKKLGAVLLILFPSFLAAQSENQIAATAAVVPLTPAQKIGRSVLGVVGPVSLLNGAFSSAIGQWRDVPHEWGQGASGYGARFASAEGYTAVHNGIALGFDLALHVDPRYHRTPQASVRSRIWNAVRQTFIARTDSGESMINVSEIAGSYGAGFVSNTWQPEGNNDPGSAWTRGSLTILFHAGRNVAREFLPDIFQRLKHHPRSDPSDDRHP